METDFSGSSGWDEDLALGDSTTIPWRICRGRIFRWWLVREPEHQYHWVNSPCLPHSLDAVARPSNDLSPQGTVRRRWRDTRSLRPAWPGQDIVGRMRSLSVGWCSPTQKGPPCGPDDRAQFRPRISEVRVQETVGRCDHAASYPWRTALRGGTGINRRHQ